MPFRKTLIVMAAWALAITAFSRVWAEETAAGDDPDGVAPASFTPAPAPDEAQDAALVDQLMRRRGGDPAAVAQLVQLARDFSPDVAAPLFETLADAHERVGNLDLAAETRRLVVERFADQPAAAAALLWLARLYASSEVAHAHRRPPSTPRLGVGALAPRVEPIESPADPASGGAAPAPSPTEKARRDAAAYALFVASRAAEGPPNLASRSALVFQRAVAARVAGDPKAAQRLLVTLRHAREGDPWADAARTEDWLDGNRDEASPTPAVRCLSAAAPHLDGVLDDACWQAAALGLAAPADAPLAESLAEIHLLHDEEYLYLAIRCVKAPGADYSSPVAPRRHDGADPRRDRVRVRLDLDRDYATAFELTIDCRGWTADRCWEDATWNPEWFVAADQDAACWTAEVAIPLAELLEGPLAPRAAWACRVERLVAGAGSQSWPPTPARHAEPSAFGILLLEPAP